MPQLRLREVRVGELIGETSLLSVMKRWQSLLENGIQRIMDEKGIHARGTAQLKTSKLSRKGLAKFLIADSVPQSKRGSMQKSPEFWECIK